MKDILGNRIIGKWLLTPMYYADDGLSPTKVKAHRDSTKLSIHVYA